MHSRRDVLVGSGALIGSAAFTGCTGLLGGDGDDSSYADWVPTADDRQSLSLTAYRPADILAVEDVTEDSFGTFGDSLSPISMTDVDEVIGFYAGTVIRGSFDADESYEAVVESEDLDVTEEESYAGYDRYFASQYDQHLGLKDGVIVVAESDLFEATVDARDGDADRFVDENDEVGRTVDELGSADIVSATVRLDADAQFFRLDEGQVAAGTRLDVASGDSEGTELVLFESEDDVDESAVTESIESDDTRTLQGTTVDGRLVRATFTQPTEELQL